MGRPRDDGLGERIYIAVRDFWKVNGYSPCIRDIMADAGVSSESVTVYHLNLLERAGRIRRTPRVARSIVVLKEERCDGP